MEYFSFAHLFLYLAIGFFQSAFSAKQYDIDHLCCNFYFIIFLQDQSNQWFLGRRVAESKIKITDQISKDWKGKDETKASVPILLRKIQVLFYTAGEIKGDRSITDYIF